MGWDGWKRSVEWEETLPDRFDPEKSVPGSNYNLHHNIVEATAEDMRRLLSWGEPRGEPTESESDASQERPATDEEPNAEEP